MTKEELKIGNYYWLQYGDNAHNRWIIRLTGWEKGHMRGQFMNIGSTSYWGETTLGSVDGFTSYRLATGEEIEQLRAHIEKGGGVIPSFTETYQIY